MKTKIYSFILLCAMLVCAVQVNAQCNDRYRVPAFANVTKTTVVYSSVYSQSMDIYEPTGDTSATRPLMILAHGGSFTSGDRTNDVTVTTFCTNFAKRGYVTVSIDYRLASSFLVMIDSAQAENEVMEAISDGKAAVRWFRMDASTTNTYRVDTNHIIVGGNSAGAVLFAHYIYIDSLGEAPVGLQSVIAANGGLEGNSGNPGYSSQVHGLLNLAGGLNVPEFIGPGSKPSFNAQGDQDGTVPYNCGKPLSGACPIRLCGLGAMEPLLVANNIPHVSIVYPGAGHVPWQGDAGETTQLDTSSANFFYAQFYCQAVTGIKDPSNINAEVYVYPNPANDQLTVSVKDILTFKEVQLIDATGRLIEDRAFTTGEVKFQRNTLSSGIYFVKIIKSDSSYEVRKVMFE